MKLKIFLLIASCAFTFMAHAKNEPFLFGNAQQKQLVINNCILAKVNGKVISVIDVMKKMDMMFYKQYPEYASIPEARFQFYQVNWKFVLEDLIGKELILADAEDNKLPVSNGDVRQEMESIFGPNIIANLDRIGLSYDEAWKMVRDDITIRRMMYLRVNGKALKAVTPREVRVAYEEYAKDNVRLDQWTYTVISIRDPDPTLGGKAAQTVYELLAKKVPVEEIATKVKDENLIPSTSTISISEENKHTEKELSASYKDILSALQSGGFSKPISQKSKADKSLVYRLFFLKDMQKGGIVPYSEVAESIQDKLLEIEAEKETKAYFAKLRKHYDVQDGPLKEMIEGGFQPFSLK